MDLNLTERAGAHLQAFGLDLNPPESLRVRALGTWRGRMINEYQSAKVFEGLARQMTQAGLPEGIVAEVEGFAREEEEHGALCGSVVQALGGAALAKLPEAESFPWHSDVSPLEGVLRNVLSVCTLSETIAVALIGAERLEMAEGPLRACLTRIYADECGHANFGWRFLRGYLPDDPALKERLSTYLAVAFAHLEAHELAHLPLASPPIPEGPAYGVCSGADGQALFYGAIHEVIIPGLEALGLQASKAWDGRRRDLYPTSSPAVQRVRGVRSEAQNC